MPSPLSRSRLPSAGMEMTWPTKRATTSTHSVSLLALKPVLDPATPPTRTRVVAAVSRERLRNNFPANTTTTEELSK